MDEEDHSAVAVEALNNRKELNVDEWFRLDPFNVVRGVAHVVSGNCGTPSLIKTLQWPYHRVYINTVYRNDLLKQKCTQNVG